MFTSRTRTRSAAPAVSGTPRTVQTFTKRPVIRGKAFFIDKEKFIARGVTYGPFAPDRFGGTYHNPDIVSRDFAMMAAHGINSIRTYTCPPRWLLDLAAEHGLHVMVGVGLAGEQLSAFLDDRGMVHTVEHRCETDVRSCANHPALFAYSIGNEIPASIVRWHGRRRVERFLKRLYDIAKDHDEDGLVTYVNYPSTEYLQLPFLDFFSYNVYLEQRDRFESYLARLQNIADYKPVVMAEIGLDSMRNGEEAQAESLEWLVRSSYAGGSAGAFVFSWTDEWHTGGADVTNWKFGITDVARQPKPALSMVSRAFADAPLALGANPPRISVVVATYNGSRTIEDCLEGCTQLDYPDYEVIVINDGSTDSTPDIAHRFNVRLISTPNYGLSRARNYGLAAATGEIIAYIDDDARPDEHWLRFIAHAFATSDHVGIGGPNIVPVHDPPLAQCVANSPGGPTHVLITDQLAEHIPGCNMSFRVDRLREVGGFDEQFRIAGDDVDVCWKLQARGWTLGFHPAAVVYHHRRNSVRAYWRQQRNYGRAEAMLELKWPEKYNLIGHVGWRGRLYGTGACRGFGLRPSRVYHGVWATAPFQPLCPSESIVGALPLIPEWYLVIPLLLMLGALGVVWPPLLACFPVALLAVAATTWQAVRHAWAASLSHTSRGRDRLRFCATTAFLHIFQPVARLSGRIGYGLTPWRRQTSQAFALPRDSEVKIWNEQWKPTEQHMQAIEAMLRTQKAPVRRGGAFDTWDLQIRGGVFASVRCRLGVEEYPGGKQYLRFRSWPVLSIGAAVIALPAAFAILARLQEAPWTGGIFAMLAVLLVLRAFDECAAATVCLLQVLDRYATALQTAPPSPAEVRHVTDDPHTPPLVRRKGA